MNVKAVMRTIAARFSSCQAIRLSKYEFSKLEMLIKHNAETQPEPSEINLLTRIRNRFVRNAVLHLWAAELSILKRAALKFSILVKSARKTDSVEQFMSYEQSRRQQKEAAVLPFQERRAPELSWFGRARAALAQIIFPNHLSWA